jgi:hypothetical protein
VTKQLSPVMWANKLTLILRQVIGVNYLPVNVNEVAQEFSRSMFPDDPIAIIGGDELPGFEGALMPLGRKGWGILYNNAISSAQRINFTIAHEFGHYLLHRVEYPKGLQCSTEDMSTWESRYAQIENQANVFAATLLMPIDDFRMQISSKSCPGLDELKACADRYQVSLIAAILRWLQFTQKRAMLVVSKDGFILWASSSKFAFKSRLYYKTRNTQPIEIPEASLAAQRRLVSGYTAEAEHNHNVWLNTACKELVLFSEQYDFTLSLLYFDDSSLLKLEGV